MIAPARRFSCLSMPSCLILEQSNATGTSGSAEDWVVTLYLPGDGATTRLADALRTAGFAVASNASETPARATNRPIKTRRLKNADCEVDFFFMELKWMGFECEALLLAEMPETRQHFFLFLLSDFFAFGSEALSLVQGAGACQHFF